jgi:ribosomal 30S subunit maturation factor RimM
VAAAAALPALAADEFYVEDLIGCTVVDLDGPRARDRPVHLLERAQDVLTVEGPDGEVLVPAVAEFIREVDLEARRWWWTA